MLRGHSSEKDFQAYSKQCVLVYPVQYTYAKNKFMDLVMTYLPLHVPCSIGYFSLSVTNRQEKLKANFCLSSQDCSSEILTHSLPISR